MENLSGLETEALGNDIFNLYWKLRSQEHRGEEIDFTEWDQLAPKYDDHRDALGKLKDKLVTYRNTIRELGGEGLRDVFRNYAPELAGDAIVLDLVSEIGSSNVADRYKDGEGNRSIYFPIMWVVDEALRMERILKLRVGSHVTQNAATQLILDETLFDTFKFERI